MALKNSSTAREILQLKREIEALKESMRPAKRWVEVLVMPGEDKSAEIAAIEAEGHHVSSSRLYGRRGGAAVRRDADQRPVPERSTASAYLAFKRQQD